MAVILQEQEARREVLSGSTGGGGFQVLTDLTSASDVDQVHFVDQSDVVDSVWLQAWNSSGAAVTLSIVLNPSDDTDTAEMALVTISVNVPANDEVWILQGNAFRFRAGNTSSITAYCATGDVGKITLTGYVVRAKGALLY